ncbi:MAG: hypothetical protein JWQ09_1010 [Segetibacter sp.]|nr:hypothetical protein [Segetibacter sp.]
MITVPKVKEKSGKWGMGATSMQPYYNRETKKDWATNAWKYINTSFDKKEDTDAKNTAIKLRFTSCLDLDIKVIERPRNVHIQIEDTNFSLPGPLKQIAEAINKSKEILSLNDDWDDEGASSTNFKTYLKAINFVVNYSKFILDTFKVIIDYPDIDILRDGSVSAFWETPRATFLIIFKKNNNPYSYFYGNNKVDEIPFKYAIKNEGKIDQITAEWMSANLT